MVSVLSSPAAPSVADKRILVTGASGFIGGCLCRRLVEAGVNQLIALDAQPIRDASLSGGNVRCVTFKLGADQPADLRKVLEGVDIVFHLAAVKHDPAQNSQRGLFLTNVVGTSDLVEQCTAAGVKNVVFASSLYAYGRMQKPPFDEAENALPRTFYGASKLWGEQLLDITSKNSGLHHVNLRYMFVYGPRQLPKHGYPSVIMRNFERLLRGEKPVVYGDGAQALDYVYVDDVVDATIRAATASCYGQTINIGSGTAITVLDLVGKMCDTAKAPREIAFAPADWTAGSCRVAEITKAREALGWIPTTTIEQGLQSTFNWLKNR